MLLRWIHGAKIPVPDAAAIFGFLGDAFIISVAMRYAAAKLLIACQITPDIKRRIIKFLALFILFIMLARTIKRPE